MPIILQEKKKGNPLVLLLSPSSPWGTSDNVDLKQIDSQIFLQQNGLIWEQQRTATQDTWSNGEPSASPEKPRRGRSFMDMGGAVGKEECRGAK